MYLFSVCFPSFLPPSTREIPALKASWLKQPRDLHLCQVRTKLCTGHSRPALLVGPCPGWHAGWQMNVNELPSPLRQWRLLSLGGSRHDWRCTCCDGFVFSLSELTGQSDWRSVNLRHWHGKVPNSFSGFHQYGPRSTATFSPLIFSCLCVGLIDCLPLAGPVTEGDVESKQPI